MTNKPPPPAHPPEGIQPRLQCSATAYPARQCELDMGHGVIHQFPPPPTPPPGPGQESPNHLAVTLKRLEERGGKRINAPEPGQNQRECEVCAARSETPEDDWFICLKHHMEALQAERREGFDEGAAEPGPGQDVKLCHWCKMNWPRQVTRHKTWHPYPLGYTGQRAGLGPQCSDHPLVTGTGRAAEHGGCLCCDENCQEGCQCWRVPGQDVEEQARALDRPEHPKDRVVPSLEALFCESCPLDRMEFPDSKYPTVQSDCPDCLRLFMWAAQAEAERRYTALKAECDADHPPEPWASELQARVEAAERRAQEAEAELAELKRTMDSCDLEDFQERQRLRKALAKAKRELSELRARAVAHP
jgi:hypothetical protein